MQSQIRQKYKYFAFISYSSQDMDWGYQQMLFRICTTEATDRPPIGAIPRTSKNPYTIKRTVSHSETKQYYFLSNKAKEALI